MAIIEFKKNKNKNKIRETSISNSRYFALLSLPTARLLPIPAVQNMVNCLFFTFLPAPPSFSFQIRPQNNKSQMQKKKTYKINPKDCCSRPSVPFCGFPFLLYSARASRYCPLSVYSGRFDAFGHQSLGPLGAFAGGSLRGGSREKFSCLGGGGGGRRTMG